MSGSPLLAWSLGTDTDPVVRGLAVAGAAALGAVLIGALAQLLVRLLTTQELPRWPLLGIRLLGGILCGWLVALWLFGGGGGGIGGSGGWGFGSGKGGGEKGPAKVKEKDAREKKPRKAEAPLEAPPADTVRVEVLGDAPLKKIVKIVGAKFDPACRYRVSGTGESPGQLCTLAEAQSLIKERRGKEPPLKRIEIVTYLDSPATGTGYVADLTRRARDIADASDGRITTAIVALDRYAPLD